MPIVGKFPEPFGTGFVPPSSPVNVINSWVKNSDDYIYGTSQITITNTTGNWLLAIVQWDEVQDPNTIVWVADDAHNFWEPVALSAVNRGVRTAVLYCANAMATPANNGSTNPGRTTVSFSSNGFIRNPIFTILEIQGMQAGYVLDVLNSNFATNTTSLSLSMTTTAVDFVLAAWTAQGTSSAGTFNLSSLGGSWLNLGQINNGADTYAQPVQGFIAFQTFASAGAFTTTLINSVNANWSGVIVGIKTAGGLPVNANNPAWPLVQLQAAFGASPGAQTSYYTWTDITSRFIGIKGSRGVDFELNQLDAADYTITIDNADGALNPFNTSSPFYPNVKLITPIRALFTWAGRTYKLFNGHLAFLPQSYEDQHGIVEAECWDDYAKLPQVILQSAMIQECLYDSPLFLWPLNDPSGAAFASNLSGQTNANLEVTNSSFGGGTTAFGITATPALGGSQGTVWGQTATSFSGSGNTGSSLRYWDTVGDYPTITSNGMGFEVWAQMPTSNTANGIPPGQQTAVFSLEGDLPGTQGQIVSVGAQGFTNPGLANLNWYDASGNFHSVNTNYQIWDNTWHHFFLAVTPTSYQLWIDGTMQISGNWTLVSNSFRIFEIAGTTSRFIKQGGITGFSVQFMLGQFTMAAIYNQTLDPERIVSHYQSGFTGFTHEYTGQRVQRFLRWSKWGRPQAVDTGLTQTQTLNYMGSGFGYGSGGQASAFGLIGSFGAQHPTAALGNSGAQADIAIQDMALTENGQITVDRNGTFTFRSRDNMYDRGTCGKFSDTFFPMNKNPTLRTLSQWSGVHNAAISQGVATWSLGGIGSILITPDGVTSGPGAQSDHAPNVVGNTPYTFDCWALSPQGWAAGVQLAILWYDSTNTFISQSTATAQYLPPMTPLAMSFQATSPSNANFAKLQPMLAGTPASSVLLVIDRPTLSQTGLAVQYESDVKINYDVTNLYNDIQVTRNFDQAFARFVDTTSQNQYFTRSYTRTIYDAFQDPPYDLNDNAAWVLRAYKDPLFRIESMRVEVAANVDYWDTAMRVDVGDIVFFSRTAPGTTAIQQGFVVLKVDVEITQDVATFSYSFGPILNPVLTLDDATLGLLGPNSFGF